MNTSNRSRFLRPLLLAVPLLLPAGAIFAQTTIHVPQNFPNIQAAIDAANPGDTILVAEGRWCGAILNKPVNLVGVDDDSTIIACPNNAGPADLKRGLLMQAGASGSTVSHFVFDGAGFSDANRAPLALGIGSNLNANNISVEHNRFVGGLFGVDIRGAGWNVSHNVFDGFTILNPPNCLGGTAISSANRAAALVKETLTTTRSLPRHPKEPLRSAVGSMKLMFLWPGS